MGCSSLSKIISVRLLLLSDSSVFMDEAAWRGVAGRSRREDVDIMLEKAPLLHCDQASESDLLTGVAPSLNGGADLMDRSA